MTPKTRARLANMIDRLYVLNTVASDGMERGMERWNGMITLLASHTPPTQKREGGCGSFVVISGRPYPVVRGTWWA